MPQTLHFSAPYQITIDGFSEARAYWRFEDMQEAAAQLEREGYRFIRYDRADDGRVRPLPQDIRDDRAETRYQRVAREQAERQRDRRLRQASEPTSIEHLGPHSLRVGERVYRNRDYAERAQRQHRARKRAILNAIFNHRSIATAILVAKMRPWEA
jgi:hypothetical protein